jgi:flagellar assembly factor FliW
MVTEVSAITIDSSRFGTLQVAPEAVIEFPTGLIGLGGHRYALLDRNPGTGFMWLHSLDDGALALPVVDPRRFFSGFVLVISEDDRERIGVADPAAAQTYVTVRAAPDPEDIVVNLRAPIVVWQGRGHQVLNGAPGAELQVPLFTREQTADGGSA